MRFRFVLLAALLTLVPFFAITNGRGAVSFSGHQPANEESAVGQDFDPRDLAGIWRLTHGRGVEPAPPMTAAGLELYGARLTDREAGSPALSNDPIYACNPQGFPRLAYDENEPMEILHVGDRILQLFQWERTLREFWLDGRDLPSGETLEDLGPAWYGHSVGEWQGDELVVYTVGLDDRAWADQSGAYPLSLHARVEERIKRIDADTLEVQLTISDPTFYAVPWTEIGPKTFTREPPESYTYSGWKGLFSGLTEAICAPMNEVDSFNRTVRDPAIFGSETSPGQ